MPNEAYQIGGSGRINVPIFPISTTRNPLTSDTISSEGSQYPVGQLWINTATNTAWIYFGGGTWAELDESTGNVLSLSDNADALTFPDLSGNIKLTAGAGITTTAGTNTITIATTGAGFKWVAVTSADNTITMDPETGYSCSGATPVEFLLPAGSFGDSYEIITNTGSAWNLTLVGQTIEIAGTVATTNVSSDTSGDVFEILCISANVFQATDVTGNLNIT